jgi:Zn-dependent peptidase ImmA (M78 family)
LVALLRWLRVHDEQARDPLKSALRLAEHSTFEDAQHAGELLAEKLSLGPVPAEKLLEKVEQQLDIPVLYVDMGKHRDISGATVHLADFNCILINLDEPAVRRAFDLAHELFHALTWEAMPPY